MVIILIGWASDNINNSHIAILYTWNQYCVSTILQFKKKPSRLLKISKSERLPSNPCQYSGILTFYLVFEAPWKKKTTKCFSCSNGKKNTLRIMPRFVAWETSLENKNRQLILLVLAHLTRGENGPRRYTNRCNSDLMYLLKHMFTGLCVNYKCEWSIWWHYWKDTVKKTCGTKLGCFFIANLTQYVECVPSTGPSLRSVLSVTYSQLQPGADDPPSNILSEGQPQPPTKPQCLCPPPHCTSLCRHFIISHHMRRWSQYRKIF